MEDLWIEIEKKCEGKTVKTLSANDFGMIIRFTDGSCLNYIGGVMRLDNSQAINKIGNQDGKIEKRNKFKQIFNRIMNSIYKGE